MEGMGLELGVRMRLLSSAQPLGLHAAVDVFVVRLSGEVIYEVWGSEGGSEVK